MAVHADLDNRPTKGSHPMSIARVTPRFALVAALAALVPAAPVAGVTAPTLNGTVGPEFTISLKRNGNKVRTLRRGRYAFVIADRSPVHNFRLRGPGIDRNLTSVPAVRRTRPITVTLRPGRYTFYCVPHPLDMVGTFRVT
jgi:hypothetical protein